MIRERTLHLTQVDQEPIGVFISMKLKFFFPFLFLSIFASAETNDEVRRDFTIALQQQAAEIVLTASNNFNASEQARQIYREIWQYLGTNELIFATEKNNFEICKKDRTTVAYVDPKTSKIHLCSRLFIVYKNKRGRLLGTIIHEVSHAINSDRIVNPQDDECGAVLISVSAFNDAGRSPREIIKHSGYILNGRCKIGITDRIGI